MVRVFITSTLQGSVIFITYSTHYIMQLMYPWKPLKFNSFFYDPVPPRMFVFDVLLTEDHTCSYTRTD